MRSAMQSQTYRRRHVVSGNQTVDLFPSHLERLTIRDAEVYHLARLDLGLEPERVAQQLIDETKWRSESISLWGKKVLQPRLIAWYGDPGKAYTYSNIRLEPTPWTPLLSDVRDRVSRACDVSFNSVLLNYYRDQKDSMGLHSDDEPELGPGPVIASLSLGAERTFTMKHRRDKAVTPVKLKLASGSLLLMRGETQRYWKHGINKQTRPIGPRVNLTFRQICPS